MLLNEILSNPDSISPDAQDLLQDFEGNLVSMITMQKGSRPLPMDVFSEALDKKAYAVRKLLRKFGVEDDRARELIRNIVANHQTDLDKIFSKN